MTNREIDAAIAEKVFGWIWDDSRCRVCGWALVYAGDKSFAGCTRESCSMRPPPPVRADSRWGHFSTDPISSKVLRGRMLELGWQFTLRSLFDGTFECTLYGIGKGIKEAGAETEEMATALAALRAFGVEV